MPNDIHFFISSLPLLRKGQKPALTYQQFIDACKRNLKPGDADRIQAVALDPQENDTPQALATARDWLDFETFVRNATAEARANRLHVPVPPKHQTNLISQFTLKLVADAFAKTSPAERESALDDARWNQLDELQAPHQFDLDFLAVYALKTLLLERIQSRQVEPGLKLFGQLVQNAVKQAAENRSQD